MKLNDQMEGNVLSAPNFLRRLSHLENDKSQYAYIQPQTTPVTSFLRNYMLSTEINNSKMDQEKPRHSINLPNNNPTYAAPVVSTGLPFINIRTNKIRDAKNAFLNATIIDQTNCKKMGHKAERPPSLHYAQIAVATISKNTKIIDGGASNEHLENNSTKTSTIAELKATERRPSIKKLKELQTRKVSFKTKNNYAPSRRATAGAKSTMTINSSKVAELTKKFNELVNEQDAPLSKSKLAKTVEKIQLASKYSASNTSTPSSTLSSNASIKIVFRQRRSNRKNANQKRYSSVSSIDKLSSQELPLPKSKVGRSKSDGNRKKKSSRKRLCYPESIRNHSSVDSVDGLLQDMESATTVKNNIFPNNNVVRNVVKKFECEMVSQTKLKNVKNDATQCITVNKKLVTEKPKIPEKKSSLIVTKNVVVKDGVPKIKTLKPIISALNKELKQILPLQKVDSNTLPKKKESLYDKNKYKTNYIHFDKIPFKLVEISHEDAIDIKEHIIAPQDQKMESVNITSEDLVEDKIYQEISSRITPNESFLWRRKSHPCNSDSERSMEDSTYSSSHELSNNTLKSFTNASDSDIKTEVLENSSYKPEPILTSESLLRDKNSIYDANINLDFESNLVEALNKEVVVSNSIITRTSLVEDDYEPLEPVDSGTEDVVLPAKVLMDRQLSKINCPLPEIPQDRKAEPENLVLEENIYQCLLEMRSHPEGDESSLHSYELCDNNLEKRTRGDGDSDDGYEYCKAPAKTIHDPSGKLLIADDDKPLPPKRNYLISKSISAASTDSYEKIGPDRIYEKIPSLPHSEPKNVSPLSCSTRNSIISSDYTEYNEGENIYDTIKHVDRASVSHCYESIPNSPSLVKMRNNFRKQLTAAVQKRLSFDTVSNISHSTLSSEQKTNSIYGQRSVINYSGQEVAFQVPNSESSVSDRSDRSDEWVDMSDPEEEKSEDQKIIIVHERSRGRKSPISWSQKVRHQWQKSPKQKKQNCEGDSSDSGHLYESLELHGGGGGGAAGARAPSPYDDDFDSFDSDSDTEDAGTVTAKSESTPPPAHARLPEPPSANAAGAYTLTKFASAAQRKMRELKRNFTKRYSVALDGKPFYKSASQSNGINSQDANMKKDKSPIYENSEKVQPDSPVYGNITFPDHRPVLTPTIKTEQRPTSAILKDEFKTVIVDKKLNNSNGDIPPPLPEKPSTPGATSEGKGKDSGTLSRKTYFSFKSRFRRASSMAVDINTDVPGALKITNSTFYLTDSIDGDSGFSNCSDGGQANGGSVETLQPTAPARRHRDSGTDRATLVRKPHKYESSPNLTLEPERARAPRPRPSAPPPPPPHDLSAVNEELKRLLPTLSRKEKSPRARTSWYAECGVDAEQNSPVTNTCKDRPNSTSWYAEVGLYQAGNISSSSGASSGSHSASPLPHSLFTHEPLYQFYNAAKIESVWGENVADSDSDGYEAVNEIKKQVALAVGRTSAMSLVSPHKGPSRTLWCEVPEVLDSAVLSSLSANQKRLQEAKFEIITSEASYLNSLNVLETHFISHPAFRDEAIMSRTDREILFATILPVRKCSQQLMNELEKCWQDNILLHGLCDVVKKHAEKHFEVYIKYCENQIFLVKNLQRLKARPNFYEMLCKLESNSACHSLSLHSFLMLPMQRITRLPLLLDAVLRNLDPADDEYQSCMDTLATLNSIVSQCNEGARSMERVEEMYRLASWIDFPAHMTSAPELAPACSRHDTRPVRWLVRSGELTHLVWRGEDQLKLTFGKKFQKVPLYLFLFNDLLVITRKRGEETFHVVDYCARSLIEISSGDVLPQVSNKETPGKHVMLLTLLENHEHKTVEMLMSCASETDASRWREALAPPDGSSGESVYAGWDCPQVAVLHAYSPAQPDELALGPGDIINVSRKMPEGWYYGERIRDGETGWFPGSYTVEVASQHVRARNLRQRYRLLALSATYLGQRKKPS